VDVRLGFEWICQQRVGPCLLFFAHTLLIHSIVRRVSLPLSLSFDPFYLCAILGKSSMVIQFVENVFVDSYFPTIERTFTKPITYHGQQYEVEIIDTAGQVKLACATYLLCN